MAIINTNLNKIQRIRIQFNQRKMFQNEITEIVNTYWIVDKKIQIEKSNVSLIR